MIKVFLACSLLTIGLGEFQFRQAKAQIDWQTFDTHKTKTSPVNWESTITETKKPAEPAAHWEFIHEPNGQNESSTEVIWEVLDLDEKSVIRRPEKNSGSKFTPPKSLEEAEALLGIIPLKESDYQLPLRLSHLVSTAETLPMEQWRIAFGTISAFNSDTNNGNGSQNYSVNLDIGFSNSLLFSLFWSQADEPLNAPLNGFSTQPSNFWQSYGAAARWQLINQNKWKLAISGSIEGWDVGSGGSSFTDAGDDTSPNIFNDSGSRVFTSNIVGSVSLPVSWQANDQWQFSFEPGASFLPATQGAGQGGAGRFYGTNPYLSGGVLFQPFPELGFNASIARPIGYGTNSFDADLEFSRVLIYSAGINWNLNPRIGLQGLITNGFGTTPATALLALPSDNRLGYSASFVYTPGTADSPQIQLTPRQQTLAKGGLTVNTALVPHDTATETWINTDSVGNSNGFIGYSLSNVFQLTLSKGGLYSNGSQSTRQAHLYTNNATKSWRIGGKAVALSPLRGAPFWGGGRISLGRNDQQRSSGQGYVFAENMATWEATKEVAININPKMALSGVSDHWGLGISTNVQLFPSLELIFEGNIVINEFSQSNSTIGFRWQATDSIAIESYASTAESLIDIGQLINADQVRWGGRMLISF